MSFYHIVDEPNVKKSENLIVNPVIILFGSILLPIFWMPPFFGRWWLPLIWLIFNGYLLGSPTLKKEIMIATVGLISLFVSLELFIYLSQVESFSQLTSFSQYVRIILNGMFFFIMYLVVFKQSTAFEIYSYMKER